MIHWEYTTIKLDASGWFIGGHLDQPDFEQRLNSLGRDGWELVSVFDTNRADGMTRHVVAVLKRPKDVDQ